MLDQSSTSTDQLLSAAKSGDADATDFLFGTVRPYVRRVAEKMLFNGNIRGTDASDVTQRTIATAIGHFSEFRGATGNEWYAWLLAIVRNDIRRLIRDANRQARLQEEMLPSPILDEDSPSQQVSGREEIARLFVALDRLPDRYRQVIQLRNLDDLSYAELAAQIGCSEPAARQLWVRAVRRLTKEIEAKS